MEKARLLLARFTLRSTRSLATDGAFGTYLGATLPRWLFALVVAWALRSSFGLPLWECAGLVGICVLTDLARYPRMRRYYESEPADRRMIGQTGFAVTELAPSGLIRVHGELWQAQLADPANRIAEGSGLRVRDIRGLVLFVDASADCRSQCSAARK